MKQSNGYFLQKYSLTLYFLLAKFSDREKEKNNISRRLFCLLATLNTSN